jgi:hypothetical protein
MILDRDPEAVVPAQAGTQYAAASRFPSALAVTGFPLSRE